MGEVIYLFGEGRSPAVRERRIRETIARINQLIADMKTIEEKETTHEQE